MVMMMVMVIVMTEVMGAMETRVMGFSPRDDGDDLFVCN